MKVLLIGGTGLISTGITRLLLERGDEVWTTTEASAQRSLQAA